MATGNASKRSNKVQDLTGMVFGRLKVLDYAGLDQSSRMAQWRCLCECGRITVAFGARMRSGNVKSCGCLNRDVNRARQYRHGKVDSTEYNSWSGIKNRCYNSNEPAFVNYGARGITVCERWRNSFEAFLEDMGPKPTPKHSIERIDNDKGYYPENCKWATRDEQGRNRRTVVMIEYKGEIRCVAEWARIVGKKAATLRQRLSKGWPIERVMESPLMKSRYG